jgi:hypothetical protein
MPNDDLDKLLRTEDKKPFVIENHHNIIILREK